MKMTKITNQILNDKITYTNETLNTNIKNHSYNGYEHLTLNSENIFAGTKRECVDFLTGLVQFNLLQMA